MQLEANAIPMIEKIASDAKTYSLAVYETFLNANIDPKTATHELFIVAGVINQINYKEGPYIKKWSNNYPPFEKWLNHYKIELHDMQCAFNETYLKKDGKYKVLSSKKLGQRHWDGRKLGEAKQQIEIATKYEAFIKERINP